MDPQSTNGRPGQTLFPGAFSSYNPPPQGEGGHPRHAQPRQQASMQQSQGYDRRHDRYVPTQQQPSDLHGAFPAQSGQGQGQGQGLSRQPPAQAPAQQRVSGLPTLSDSSEDEDDLPLPGSTSMRAMSVLQKYLSGADGAAATAPTTAAATPPAAAAAPMAGTPRSAPVAKAASYVPTEPSPGHIQLSSRAVLLQGRAPPQQAPAPAMAAPGYSSDSEHSQLNGNLGSGLGRQFGASGGGGRGGAAAASDDMDMSPILDKGDSLDAKALAKLPAQVYLVASVLTS